MPNSNFLFQSVEELQLHKEKGLMTPQDLTRMSKIVEHFSVNLSQNTHPRPTLVMKNPSTSAKGWQCLKQFKREF